jgi:hypothetical protein
VRRISIFTVPAEVMKDFQVRDHTHLSTLGDTFQGDVSLNKLLSTRAIAETLEANSLNMRARNGIEAGVRD